MGVNVKYLAPPLEISEPIRQRHQRAAPPQVELGEPCEIPESVRQRHEQAAAAGQAKLSEPREIPEPAATATSKL